MRPLQAGCRAARDREINAGVKPQQAVRLMATMTYAVVAHAVIQAGGLHSEIACRALLSVQVLEMIYRFAPCISLSADSPG